MPRTAIDVIRNTLRNRNGADDDTIARRIAADLNGNGYPLDTDGGTPRRAKQTAPPKRCRRPIDPHSGTELVAGRCPTCGWTENAT